MQPMDASNLVNKHYTYCELAICRYGDERSLLTSVDFNG